MITVNDAFCIKIFAYKILRIALLYLVIDNSWLTNQPCTNVFYN